MSLPPLTIRNLTASPIELKLVERFEHETLINPVCLGAGHITRSFSYLMRGNWSPPKTPSSADLALKSASFSRTEFSIRIAPFEIITTEIQACPKLQQIVRLTFENDGHKYRVDTPINSSRSILLTPLSTNPPAAYTAVYLHETSLLALSSRAILASWMSKIKDGVLLSALSIPGTHNSATHYKALPSVRCQAVSIAEQLNNGIRFLDIRVQPEQPNDPSNGSLVLVHSAFPVSLTGPKYFRSLINDVESFLRDHPSETVLISLKREGIGNATDEQLSKILYTHYTSPSTTFFTENRIPLLCETRGKIVLIRRFAQDDSLRSLNCGSGYCIDAECWPDNTPNGITTSGKIRVQDYYDVLESSALEKKFEYLTAELVRSAAKVYPLPDRDEPDPKGFSMAHQQPLFLNFLSGSNFFNPSLWPRRIAAKINPQVLEYLSQKHNAIINPPGDGSTGIVVCDWIGLDGDWDLAKSIVGMNANKFKI